MADTGREGQPSILGWCVTLIAVIAEEKLQSHYLVMTEMCTWHAYVGKFS